jgi:hypothetical protein
MSEICVDNVVFLGTSSKSVGEISATSGNYGFAVSAWLYACRHADYAKRDDEHIIAQPLSVFLRRHCDQTVVFLASRRCASSMS